MKTWIKDGAKEKLKLIFKTEKEIVLICIGTDKVIGDAYGPLLGTLLTDGNFRGAKVYGTLEDPIHALNLENKLFEIMNEHPEAYIIGIDACLGDVKRVGEVSCSFDSINPGKGVGKDLPSVGQAKIVGITGRYLDAHELFTSRNVRLGFIYNMAKSTAEMLFDIYEELHLQRKSA